jgi:rhamnulokinase
MYNTAKRRWSTELLESLDIPTRMFRPPVEPGTKLGRLRSPIATDTSLTNVEIIVPGTHDTASAVMAVPAALSQPSAKPDWCYLSSGTWSLLGVEVPQPVINDECLALNFTNEGGVGGTIRLLKNITGLWLVQECRRAWSRSGKSWSWDELNRHAAQAPALKAHINPDHADFMAPDNMPEAIRTACRNSGQTVPESDGAIIRTALESLALKYRQVLGWTESLVHTRLNTIHVVGGGAQNRQLCQMTADACGRTVVSGPVEATALGNVLMQAVAAGSLGSIADARSVVRESFPVETFEPKSTAEWDAAYERFVALT